MRLISNLKIRTRLLGSFLVLCVVIFFVGAVGMIGMRKINEYNDIIYSNNYVSTSYIQDVNNNLSDIRLYTQRVVTEDLSENLENNVKAIDALVKADNDLLAKYEALLQDDEDIKLFNELNELLANYRGYRADVVDMAREGKYTEAVKYNATDVEEAVVAVQDKVDEIRDFNLNAASSSMDSATGKYDSNSMLMIWVVVIAIILAVCNGFIMSGMITIPLNAVKDVTDNIAKDNLRKEVPKKLLSQKDEIGILAQNVEIMRKGLINTVLGIKNSTDDLGEQIAANNRTLSELDSRISETSAATEELSAGMEETGASSEEMNASAIEIEHAVQNVAEKAEDGANKAGEIHSRASDLERDIQTAQERTLSTFQGIKTGLTQALEESRAVEEINVLAEAILGITSQTTLLALNASIEAARAGEAGRGFAVVANEISALADNSKETANKIQNITKVVHSAVDNLSSSSNELLEFVAQDVSNDYVTMLQATKAYNDDSIYVSDMTSDLNATAEQLLASVHGMMKSIESVAYAAQEGAKTTAQVAEQTTEVASGAASIVDNMKKTELTSDQLLRLVNQFQI